MPWEALSGHEYCDGTEECSAAKVRSTNYCQSRTDSIGFDPSFKYQELTLGLHAQIQLNMQQCYNDGTTNTCEWDDKGCHTVWGQQQMVRSKGYTQQHCGKREIHCTKSWAMDTPTTTINVACGAFCNDTHYCRNEDGSLCDLGKAILLNRMLLDN